jgi:Ala-tRNA(Pro) deacylase
VRPRSLDTFLRHAHVPFTTIHHTAAYSAQHQAAAAHVPGASWAKTVICVADGEPIAAVVPAHLMVDLERLRVAADARTLRIAHEHELTAICADDCEPGAVSPFASRRPLRVFVDVALVGEPDMALSAGTHTDAIRMHYGDFAELTCPFVAPIGVSRKPAGSSSNRLAV